MSGQKSVVTDEEKPPQTTWDTSDWDHKKINK